MAFINQMIDSGSVDALKLFEKSGQNACTYPDFYRYWKENLFERLFRLFIYEGMDDEIMPREIEQRLFLAGHCGIAQYKKKLTAFFGSFFGVTVYQDQWTNYNVHSPIYSGTYDIDKNIVIINNNSLRNPSFLHVDHYAKLLAHAEVTLMMAMVQARDSGGVPVAQNEKVKQSILSYQAKQFNGKIGCVMDQSGIGVEYMGADRHTQSDINSVWEVRTKLLKNFYSDIGIRSSFDKKSNAVVDEITSDSTMLLYNVSDMLEERKTGIEKVNEMFGTNWSVRLSDQIDYDDENEAVEEVSEDVSMEDNRGE